MINEKNEFDGHFILRSNSRYKKTINFLNMYTTYVMDAYMGTFRYIHTCECECRYMCAYV